MEVAAARPTPSFAELLAAELKLDRSQWEEKPAPTQTSEKGTQCLEIDSLVRDNVFK